jgi:hypothetical protein
MRVGIDIDNTIICYDGVFASVAQLIGHDIDVVFSKEKTKDWFHSRNMYDEFTELQGLVYGSYLGLSSLYDGVKGFLNRANLMGCTVFIVSHKTRYPLIGDKVDLHNAASVFLSEQGIIKSKSSGLVPAENLFYETSLNDKIERIAALQLDYFIDDLSDVLNHDSFPKSTHAIQFFPGTLGKSNLAGTRLSSWQDIHDFILTPDCEW